MIHKVRAAVEKYEMLKAGDRVTVALSGGADSVALLHVLNELRGEFHITVSAAHLNHGIRGEEAKRDQEFCRDLCRSLGVPFTTETVSVPGEMLPGESEELCARRLRYEFLNRVSDGVIATAHTASDSAETMLFNLSRGTGLKGFCGIPPKNGGVIRPLILAAREDVERYCRENGLSYVIDSTNLSDDYTRNRIRHTVIPALESINPSFVENACRAAENLRRDSAYLESLADIEYQKLVSDGKLDIKAAALPECIASRVAASFIAEMTGCAPDSIHISKALELIKRGSGKLSLNGGREAVCSGGFFRIADPPAEPFCVPVRPGIVTVAGKRLEITPVSGKECMENAKIHNLLLNECFDCDKISGVAVIRSRKEGDRIRPRGRGVTKSLKNLFAEQGIASDQRGAVPLIADDAGVIWMDKVPVARRVEVDSATVRAMRVKLLK